MEKQLRILQVVPYFYPAWAYGGIPRVVYELSGELVKRGHSVTVYTTDVLDQDSRCSQSGTETVVDGITVRYFKNLSNRMAYDHQVFLPIGFREAIGHTISGFDVVHLHGHRNILNNIVHHYAKKFKKKYVLSGHGTIPRIERRVGAKVIFDMFFGNRVLKYAERFIAVSGHEVAQYMEMGIERKKVSVIYNGIDIDAYSVMPEKNSFRKRYGLTGKKIILFLGKITPRKGVDFLVKAFAELNMDDSVLVIAGNDMGFRGKVEAIIKERHLAERVVFTGLLADDEKRGAYQDADVVVYPAIHEIFGLVPFEAMMCGAPVIVTDDCGCGEIIGREGLGYLVRYGDIGGLTARLAEVLSAGAAARETAARGREFILKNLNWELIAEKHLEVYRGLLS
ncbi:MAG: glycosyltransferase family 4 protein [Thermodesulfovibrionales bacterium]|nr:glycosyltransferase family 4 protein [Thermodesulfovibrionales bacterium]